MRVLHIQRVKGIGGSERHLLDLIPGLREAGLDARLFVLAAEGANPFIAAVRSARVPFALASAGADVSIGAIRRIGSAIEDFRPDLVHTHLIHADLHGMLATQGAAPR